MSASSPSYRVRAFKNKGRDPDYMRRRRTEIRLELRKRKREESLSKRRICSDKEPSSPLQNQQNDKSLFEKTARDDLISSDPPKQLIATQNASNPPIDVYVQKNIVPNFAKFLERVDNVPLQFEAARALTNITSGTTEQTVHVVEAGAAPLFIHLLSSPHNVAEQAVWALGNITGTRLVPCNFIAPVITQNPISNGVHHEILLANFLAQTEALMKGKTENKTEAELIKSESEIPDDKIETLPCKANYCFPY